MEIFSLLTLSNFVFHATWWWWKKRNYFNLLLLAPRRWGKEQKKKEVFPAFICLTFLLFRLAAKDSARLSFRRSQTTIARENFSQHRRLHHSRPTRNWIQEPWCSERAFAQFCLLQQIFRFRRMRVKCVSSFSFLPKRAGKKQPKRNREKKGKRVGGMWKKRAAVKQFSRYTACRRNTKSRNKLCLIN